jgi:hypothetical protein
MEHGPPSLVELCVRAVAASLPAPAVAFQGARRRAAAQALPPHPAKHRFGVPRPPLQRRGSSRPGASPARILPQGRRLPARPTWRWPSCGAGSSGSAPSTTTAGRPGAAAAGAAKGGRTFTCPRSHPGPQRRRQAGRCAFRRGWASGTFSSSSSRGPSGSCVGRRAGRRSPSSRVAGDGACEHCTGARRLCRDAGPQTAV